MAVGFSRIAAEYAKGVYNTLGGRIMRRFSFKGGSYNTKNQVSMLMFDRDGKAPIFNHATGGNVIKWYLRGITAFTLLSLYLAWAEFQDPSRKRLK